MPTIQLSSFPSDWRKDIVICHSSENFISNPVVFIIPCFASPLWMGKVHPRSVRAWVRVFYTFNAVFILFLHITIRTKWQFFYVFQMCTRLALKSSEQFLRLVYISLRFSDSNGDNHTIFSLDMRKYPRGKFFWYCLIFLYCPYQFYVYKLRKSK